MDQGWLNEQHIYSGQKVAEVTGLSIQQVDELIEIGVIAPVDTNARPMYFRPRYIVVASMARRLRDDFELDRHGVTLAMSLIKRIEELEMELNALRTARSRHVESALSMRAVKALPRSGG